MSILGASPDRFDKYDNDIREEFADASDEEFIPGRLAFFRGVLELPRIFIMKDAHDLLEGPARENIRRKIAEYEERKRSLFNG